MELVLNQSVAENLSKKEIINRISLLDEIISMGYTYAQKYVLDDLTDFYKEIKGKNYSALRKGLFSELKRAI